MINPIWLKTFCTLVEVRHFTKTADKLFMTQSGVSQHIRKLENYVGSALLVRTGKSFSLTEVGQRLYQQGKEILNANELLAHSLLIDEPHVGEVKLASPGSIGIKLYDALLDVQTLHNELAIDYRFAPNEDVEHKLKNKVIDIGLTTELCKEESVISEHIGYEQLVLVTPHTNHSVDWKTLISLGFVSHPDAAHHANLLLGSNFKQYHSVKQFRKVGFSNQIGLILEPISRGIGFTVLPQFAVSAFAKQALIKIHPLTHYVKESLYLCRNRQAYITKRSEFIANQIREVIGLT